MHEQLSTKLHKIGEHGVGKHVLVFIADHQAIEQLPFKGHIGNDWKVHYFHVNLKDDYVTIGKKMVNSLNYYHYADTLLFDFPAFLLFLSVIERVFQANEVIKRIIVFNPLAADATVMEKLTRYFVQKKYINLLGQKVDIPKKLLSKFTDIFEKLHFVHAREIVVMGMENKTVALKLAARLKNSRLETCRDYAQATEFLLDEFR